MLMELEQKLSQRKVLFPKSFDFTFKENLLLNSRPKRQINERGLITKPMGCSSMSENPVTMDLIFMSIIQCLKQEKLLRLHQLA